MKNKEIWIYIEWEDAWGNHDGDEWYNKDELKKKLSEPFITMECGVLIEETEEYISIAGRATDFYDEFQYKNYTRIPKTWIRKKKILKI